MVDGRQKLPLPANGLSDADSFSDQPLGTTSEAVNVRGHDPVTGRQRISQRAGSTKYITDQVITSGKVDRVEAVTYDVPRVKYTQETTGHTVVWSKTPAPGNGAWSAQTDRQGNIYVVTVQGTVQVYNSEGEYVASINSPLPTGYGAVPVLALDEIDQVFIAASESKGTSTGRVWKFIKVEKPDGGTEYDQAWTIEHDSGIADIAVRGGMLAVLGDGITTENKATLTAYISTNSSTPLQLWTTTVPTPANGLAINSSGEILITCEPAENRGALGSNNSWGAENIAWSPHEEFESETRLHSWVDAKQPATYTDGEDVTLFEDRRYIATDLDNPLSASNHLRYAQPGAVNPSSGDAHTNEPTDSNAPRYFHNQKTQFGIQWTLAAPEYRLGLFDDFPSIEFSGTKVATNFDGVGAGTHTGTALWTLPGAYPFKDNSDGDSEGTNGTYASFIPGHDPWAVSGLPNGNGFVYSWAMVMPEKTVGPQVVWATPKLLGTGRIGYACVYNAYYDGTKWSEIEGRITFVIEDGASDTIVTAFSMPMATWDTTGRRLAVCTFVHPGHDEDGGTNALYDDRCVFRINGMQCDNKDTGVAYTTLTGQSLTQQSQAKRLRTTWGAGHNNTSQEDNDALSILAIGVNGATDPDKPLYTYGFSGHKFEGLCLLHPDSDDTSVVSNDQDTGTQIETGWGKVQPMKSSDNDPPDAAGDNSGTLDITDYGTTYTAAEYTMLATTVERLEGYLAHAWGSSDALPATAGGADGEGLYPAHPFSSTRVPTGTKNGYNGYGTTTGDSLNSPRGILAKYSGSSGDPIWARVGAGIGYGITLDDEDNPMTVGPQEDGTSDEDLAIARRVIDQGTTSSILSGDGAWVLTGTVDGAETQNIRTVRLASDSEGDLYWPVSNDNETPHLRVIDKEDGTETYNVVLSTAPVPYSVAFPPVLPSYGDATITGPEFCYITTDGGTDSHATVYKVELVSSVQAVDGSKSLRRHDVAVIGHGDIKLISDGVLSTPTGGSGALRTRSPYVQAVQLFGKVYITDGETYKVLDPKAGTVEDYAATDGGELPKRGRILTAWRGRIIISRAADDPYEIYASALGDPDSWDIYPATLSVTQPWHGRSAGVGRAPDIVNAFIPMTDDLALIGGDHSIHRMTGDPAAGGQVDTVTDQIGIAYGDAWTKDPYGSLFFYASRGGVYVLLPNGTYRCISTASQNDPRDIRRRLQDLNLDEYKVRLVWDYRLGGLHVFPVPWGAPGVRHKGWFWEQKTGSWWEDEWRTAGLQPSSACILDGDRPSDRRVILGCEDGYVRYVDESNKNDDSTLIDSRVLVGPLVPSGTDLAYRFMRPQITLASDQDGATYELYASDVADVMGSQWASGELVAGRSEFLTGRTRGAAVWLRIRNNATSQRFSLEDATIAAVPAGRAVSR